MNRKGTVEDLDVHLGRVLKAARLAKGYSQTKLSDALGVTYNQLQKYENGVNRISASKLYKAAVALDIPIEDFFIVGKLSPKKSILDDMGTDKQSFEMLSVFNKIMSKPLKAAIIMICKAL